MAEQVATIYDGNEYKFVRRAHNFRVCLCVCVFLYIFKTQKEDSVVCPVLRTISAGRSHVRCEHLVTYVPYENRINILF